MTAKLNTRLAAIPFVISIFLSALMAVSFWLGDREAMPGMLLVQACLLLALFQCRDFERERTYRDVDNGLICIDCGCVKNEPWDFGDECVCGGTLVWKASKGIKNE